MNGQGSEQLTLFPADSPVSRSLAPGGSEARRTTVISGQKCSELYGNSGPLGCLVRMCLASSIWHSTRCFLIWKAQDMKHSRLLFRLVASMPRTSGNGCALWPTITASGFVASGHQAALQRMVDKGMLTAEERRRMIAGNCGHINPELAEWWMGYTKTFTELMPTPIASGYKGATAKRYAGGVLSDQSARIAGSHPAWDNWPDEPGIPRVVDGRPHRVDRVKALGNAVVPQQFYLFFQLIADIEAKGANANEHPDCMLELRAQEPDIQD